MHAKVGGRGVAAGAGSVALQTVMVIAMEHTRNSTSFGARKSRVNLNLIGCSPGGSQSGCEEDDQSSSESSE
jgi:hypothetical protein